jgi:hypothetical protein
MIARQKINMPVQVGKYAIPALKDRLVLGKQSPIGRIAMRRAIELLVKAPFEPIELKNEVISDRLVRQQPLRRISKEELIDFVMTHVKPLMKPDEVLHAELEVNDALSVGR